MSAHPPGFRPGRVLATRFTGTLSERCGDCVERIPTPERLSDWFAVNDLAVGACTTQQFERAHRLREALHAVLTAAAVEEETLPEGALRVLNGCAETGRATPVLTPERRLQWQLGAGSEFDDALGVIAADAIAIVAGERDGRLALCASPTCRAAFFDTSRSRTRRWCDMNTCGNREKKARFTARRQAGSSTGRDG